MSVKPPRGSAPHLPTNRRGDRKRRSRTVVNGGTNIDTARNSCERCEAFSGGVCAACRARRRRRAIELRDKNGLTVQQIAEQLNITVAHAARLIEEAEQLRDLEQYRCNAIPVAPIRELVQRRLKEDRTLSQARLAAAVQTDRIELLRVLGLQPTASRMVRGQRRPGALRTEISVEMAGKIVKALDIAPHEVAWL